MAEHTKEPWRDLVACADYETHPYLIYSGATPVAAIIREDRGEDEGNAARIVACVNACEGMVDPAAEIARLRAEIARLRAEMVEARAIMTDAMRSLQACKDAPGAYKTTCTQQLADFLADKPDRLTIAAMSQLG